MAGTSLSARHSTIPGLLAILTDTSPNTSLVLFSTQSTTVDATASVYQKGSLTIVTSSATGISGVFTNVGTALLPVWSKIGAAGVAEINGPTSPLFLLDGGYANVIAVTAYAVGTTFVPLVTGLIAGIRVATTTTGWNTAVNVIFNGTTKPLRSHFKPLQNVGTSYVAGGVLWAIYTPGQGNGGCWQDLSR